MNIDSLSKYFTLLLPLFGFLAYWIKRHYDYKTKKNEIKFNLFYQNKIYAIKDFFAAYMDFEMTFNSHYSKLLDRSHKGEFDKYFVPVRDKLFYCYSHIQLFVDNSNQKPYKRILDRNVYLYNETFRIAMNISDLVEGKNSIIKGNEIHSLSRKTNDADKKDLEIIAAQTRIDFNISR